MNNFTNRINLVPVSTNIDLYDLLNAIKTGESNIAFVDAQDNSKYIIYDKLTTEVLKEVLPLKTVEVVNDLTICCDEPMVNDGTKDLFIRIMVNDDYFPVLDSFNDGVEEFARLLSDAGFNREGISTTATRIIALLSDIEDNVYESPWNILLEGAKGLELETDIKTEEELARYYADMELQSRTVEALEDYVDWSALGYDLKDSDPQYQGFFTDIGYIFTNR